jgi:type 1 glutamine amidotransferase
MGKNLFLILVTFLAGLAVPGFSQTPSSSPGDRLFKPGLLRVLILSGHNNHKWRDTTPFLKKLLEKTGRFDVRVCEEPAGISSTTLAPYHVLVNDYGGPRWGNLTETAVEEFIRSGKGMVVVHGAIYSFSGLETLGDGHAGLGLKEPAWEEFARMNGACWPAPPAGGFHAPLHFFQVKATQPAHPILKGLPAVLPATDELYHGLTLLPQANVLATAYDEAANGGTGKDEPMLITTSYGKGRVFYTALGHELPAMLEKSFFLPLVRGTEWAATGEVTIPADFNPFQTAANALRILVVTGGHDYESSFYTLFEPAVDFTWNHLASNTAAFQKDLRQNYDVLFLYDFSQQLDEAGKRNLQAFAEAGKGIVVVHHAIADYQDWPWWWKEVVGGRYLLKQEGTIPASTYKHDEELLVLPVANHPILQGIVPMHIWDETYKGMWISPQVKVLLKTENPTSDGPLAWISPYPKSRVTYIQLGHDTLAYRHPSYRNLIHNAILWAGGKLHE